MADINLGVGGANSAVAGGYDIANSVKIEADNAEVFKRTYGSGGNVQKWTFSVWYKRTELTGGRIFGLQTGGNTFLQFASDKLRWYVGGNDQYTEAVYRDTSAWYHIVLQFDTTQATASNRTKIYVNGVQQTLTGSYVNQYTSSIINSATTHGLGGNEFFNSEQVNGYMAEVHFVDGQALEPSDFGEYDEDSGIWKPKEYEGTYGTTGWYLDFEDAANLGDDVSGNNNHWTETNITSADQATDTPTNNFCTLNPLLTNAGSANYLTMTEGATKGVNAGNAYRLAVGSMGVTSGKWYWEVKATSVGATMYMGITYPSIWDTDYTLGGTIFLDDNNDPVRYNATGRSSFGSAFGNGDIIAFALDMDASTPTMTVYKNNSSLGNLMSGLSIGGTGTAYLPPKEEGYFPKIGGYGAMTFECNFGGYTSGTPASPASDENGYGTFEYAPPSGYYALCTKNLAEYG